MAKKKNTQILLSQEENAQALQIFEHYQQIATTVRASNDQQQISAALAEINTLPENAQMALLKKLAKEQRVDAADILTAVHEFGASKTVRKEARRSLIQLEGTKIYPRWQPPAEQMPMPSMLQLPTNPPLFWKGSVTDSEESGEVQLLLAWQQGEDYKEVRMFGFLLEFWHDGVKDFFTRIESKRSFENFVKQITNGMPDIKLRDCSLAEGRRLLQEALSINTQFGTKPHRDYQLNLSLINRLILEAPGISEETLLEEIDDDDWDLDELQGLSPSSVVAYFVNLWVDGDYELAYHLLAQDSSLREGTTLDEWIERRNAWAASFKPDELLPGLLFEREAPKSKLWLPNPFNKTSTPVTKEIEATWSIELDKTPLDDRLPELPAATTIYTETGRHWFWATYTLVQENDEWRIQNITDEGMQARNFTVEELQKRVQQLHRDAEKRAEEIRLEKIDQMSEPESLLNATSILQILFQSVNYMDALLTKLPLERTFYEKITSHLMLLGDYERCLVYLTPLVERFPEERALILRFIAQAQQLRSEECFEQDDNDERAERFAELAQTALRASLAIEENGDAHISLAEILIDEGKKLDEAEEHLMRARELITTPDEEAHIEMHLGEIAINREQYQKALTHYQRVAELQPNDAESWFAMGTVHQMLMNVEEAAASYQRAIELEPDNISYYSKLGLLYKSNGLSEQAIKSLDDGIRANPDSAELLAYRSLLYAESGDYEQANTLLDKAEQIDPESELIQPYRQMIELNRATPLSAPQKPLKLSGSRNKQTHHRSKDH